VSFERARKIADAVLYEGYVLYPYRASAAKNRVRWQWGVLAPESWCAATAAEASWLETQCLLETHGDDAVAGRVRFLHVESRVVERSAGGGEFSAVESLEVGGELWTTWDEAVEHEVDFTIGIGAGAGGAETVIPFTFAGEETIQRLSGADGEAVGRVVRRRLPIEGRVRAGWVTLEGPYPLVRLRVRVENTTAWDDLAAPREAAIRASFVGTHTLLESRDAPFLSLVDPPEWAGRATRDCENVRTWPILAGETGDRHLVLSAPIILYDHPEIAPESPGDLFDATEIDEILSLRTMTLTEDEKREARSTDPRAAAILDRVDAMPPEILERLHGAIRELRPVRSPATAPRAADPSELPPWWDPGADASVSPETDAIEIAGVRVARGSRLRLRPGLRRADAQDMFLAGKTARVEAVLFDVDDQRYLAVTLEEDPAADLQQAHGRFLYFAPDEVEPLGDDPGREEVP
jgi:hypothetical protein